MSLIVVLSSLIASAQTPTTNLTTHQPLGLPPGATFEWHTGSLSSSPLVSTPTAVGPGLYYGFYNYGAGCFSEAAPIRIITNTCPTTTVDLNTAVNAPPSGSTLSFHSNTPVSDANAITGTAITQAGAGTYFVAYKTTVSGTSCYSEASPIVVVITPFPTAPVALSPVFNPCPLLTVNLNNISAALTPSVSGGVFEWHVSNLSSSALVSTPTAVGLGTYYLFEKSPAGCYSAGTPLQVQIQNCCPLPECIPLTVIRINR